MEGINFADAINKAATRNETPKGTDAFRPESSDEVMQAWDKALAETGVNPFPMNRISTALVLHVESGQLAPTAVNFQPQKIYVLKSMEAVEKIRSLTRFACADKTKVWRSSSEPGYDTGCQYRLYIYDDGSM